MKERIAVQTSLLGIAKKAQSDKRYLAVASEAYEESDKWVSKSAACRVLPIGPVGSLNCQIYQYPSQAY